MTSARVFLLVQLWQLAFSFRPPGSPDTAWMFNAGELPAVMFDQRKSPMTTNRRFAETRSDYRTRPTLLDKTLECQGCEGVESCVGSDVNGDVCVGEAPPEANITEMAWLIVPSPNTCGDASMREHVFGFQIPGEEFTDWVVYPQDLYLNRIVVSSGCAGIYMYIRPIREDASRLSCQTTGNDGKLVEYAQVHPDGTTVVKVLEDIPLSLYNRRWIFVGVDERSMPPGVERPKRRHLQPHQTADKSLEDLLRMSPEVPLMSMDVPNACIGGEKIPQPINCKWSGLPLGPYNRADGDAYAHRFYYDEPREQVCWMAGQFYENIAIAVKRVRRGQGGVSGK